MKITMQQIIGTILWWTEGTKCRKDKRWKNSWMYNVEVTNTNPDIIKIFLDFLRSDIGIEERRLKLQLQIHEGDNKIFLENYWSKITNIPKSRFNKTIIRPQGNKVGKSKGTCKVRYTSKEVYQKLSKMVDTVLNKI